MFRGDVFVFEVLSFLERLLQHFGQRDSHARLRVRALDLRQLRDRGVDSGEHLLDRHTDFFQHRDDHAFAVFQQRGHQVDGLYLRIAIFGRVSNGGLDGFL